MILIHTFERCLLASALTGSLSYGHVLLLLALSHSPPTSLLTPFVCVHLLTERGRERSARGVPLMRSQLVLRAARTHCSAAVVLPSGLD